MVIRFRCLVQEDYHSMKWPVRYPYWCAGFQDSFLGDGMKAILVGYADSVEEIKINWPEAEEIDYVFQDSIEFTDRFPKPDWYEEK